MNQTACGVFTSTACHALKRLVFIAAFCALALGGCTGSSDADSSDADSSDADSTDADSKVTTQTPVSDTSLAQPASTSALHISANNQDDSYVGSIVCGQCHQEAFEQWQQSHHAQAMAHPTAQTVKGDFASSELTVGDQRIGFSL
ncbi:MAG: hypothetical protein ISQ65_08390, partial [Pseudomonadales bacterium]|nr:hypothetical protein [Pseudomonadales bacterium]